MSYNSESDMDGFPAKNPLTQQASRANLEKEIAEIADGTHMALNMRRNSITKRLQGQPTNNYRQSSQANLNLGGGQVTQAYARAHMAVLGHNSSMSNLQQQHDNSHAHGGVFSPIDLPRRNISNNIKQFDDEAEIQPPWLREDGKTRKSMNMVGVTVPRESGRTSSTNITVDPNAKDSRNLMNMVDQARTSMHGGGDDGLVSPLALPFSALNINENTQHNKQYNNGTASNAFAPDNASDLQRLKSHPSTPPSTPYLAANLTQSAEIPSSASNNVLDMARARALSQLQHNDSRKNINPALVNDNNAEGASVEDVDHLDHNHLVMNASSQTETYNASFAHTDVKAFDEDTNGRSTIHQDLGSIQAAIAATSGTHVPVAYTQEVTPREHPAPNNAAQSAEMLRQRRERQELEEEIALRDEQETMEFYTQLKQKAISVVEGSANRYNKLVTMAGRHAFCTADDLYNLIMTPHDALLMSHIAKPLLRIIDCRGKEDYLVQHIRGALYMTECTTQCARNALNTTPHFEQRAAALDPRNTIVFYGDEEVDDGKKPEGENIRYSKLHAQLVQIMALVDDGISRLFTLRGGIEDFKNRFPFLICNIPHDVVYDADAGSVATSMPNAYNMASSSASLAGSHHGGRRKPTVRRRDVNDRAMKKQDIIDSAAVKIPSHSNEGRPYSNKRNRNNGYDDDHRGRRGHNGSNGDSSSNVSANNYNRHVVFNCPYHIPRSEMPELRSIREAEGGVIDETEFAGTLQNGHKIPGTSAFEFDPDLNVYPNLILEPWLFLGDQRCSWSLASLIDLQITHIINISTDICNYFEDHPAAKLPNGQFIKYLTIRMHDDRNSDIQSQFQMVFAFIDMAKQTDRNAKIMVHCQMGISRSASLIIAYIMHLTHCSLKDIYYYVKARRYIVQPNSGFWVQLSNAERHMRNNVTTVYDIMEAGLRKESSSSCGCCSIS